MKLICLGDSNTYGYDPRSYLGGRYPAQSRWVDLLAEATGWQAINEGENGRQIPRREIELQSIRRLLGNTPDALLLVMLGTNDLLCGADAQTVAERMDAFLTALPFDPARTLLIAPPPLRRSEWVTEAATVEASRRLAACYRALARARGTGFADAGAWQVELAFDGVHFSEAGHRAFARGLARHLEGNGL